MDSIERINIDVRDVDHEWFRDVAAYHDRDADRYYFPRESIDRLGELDPDTGDAWLIDGIVEARAEEIDIGGRRTPCWSVGCGRLTTRPASRRARRAGDEIYRA